MQHTYQVLFQADYTSFNVQCFVWLLLVLFEVLLSWLCTKRNTDVRKSLRNFDAWLELQKIYKAANFVSHSHLSQLFGMTKCFIDVNMWPPFLTCCYRVVARLESLPDSQPEELWSETKPSVQTYKQTKLYPLSVLQYSVRNSLPNRQLMDADRHTVWCHAAASELSSSFWVLNKRENEICIY